MAVNISKVRVSENTDVEVNISKVMVSENRFWKLVSVRSL